MSELEVIPKPTYYLSVGELMSALQDPGQQDNSEKKTMKYAKIESLAKKS